MKNNVIYRQLIASIIFAAFFAQTFSNAFVIVGYYTNTSKYAKYCENKDKPMMHCNGKCQMMKKIQQEEKKDQSNPERKSENRNEIVLFSKSSFATIPNIYILIDKSKKNIPDFNNRPIKRSLAIFHPPQAFC